MASVKLLEDSDSPREELPSLAVIASDGNGNGVVLWYVGHHLDIEIKECGLKGLEDLGLDDAPLGISIWEGKYLWFGGSCEYPMEGYTEPRGSFRKPTPDEWNSIKKQECPWHDIKNHNL